MYQKQSKYPMSGRIFILVILIGLIAISCQVPYKSVVTQQLVARRAMVVSAHPLASQVGTEIMRKGGNAVDAAVAVQFALAVVYPRAGNIGGGGFMMIREKDGKHHALDFRETAPALASKDMFLDSLGNVRAQLSTKGHLASGVPGIVEGMVKAHEKFGRLDWKALLQPAILLANAGFQITKSEADRLNSYQQEFKSVNTAKTVFMAKKSWKAGDKLKQTNLAHTLKRIQQQGRDGFYEGKTASLIVAEMQRGDGILTYDDLRNYTAKWRQPVSGYYKNYRITSMPPPSSGGIALLQILEMLEPFPLRESGLQNPQTIHFMVEAMRRAYADRAEHLGDSDFFEVPISRLLDSIYLLQRMSDYDPKTATVSSHLEAGKFSVKKESFETTHFSIIDPEGNAVALTTTINSNYGNKVVVGGAGFFLNNEMDDFSLKPGVPNQFGLIGKEANAIAPDKRMLSTMTPTILEKDGKLWMVVGTPGGSTIITGVLQVILNVLEFDLDLDAAIRLPRFHHQWLPDEIWVEQGGFDAMTIKALNGLGHKIVEKDRIAKVKAILVLPDGKLYGVGDPRLEEDSAAGY